MDALLKSFKEMPQRVLGLPLPLRIVVLGGAAALLIALALVSSVASSSESFQYAFTNLTAEDSSEAASQLKASGIPFRIEANGAALAVPASKVHDVRLLLASAGLPRGGGVGFELFDRGDLGVSEFTQRVNLRRALEGELARTIGRLAAVRSARVHLTMGEKGLYRDEDKKPSAAVVVNLQPGRTLGDKELAGVRHLVSSAVSGLSAEQVTVVDGKGTVLAAESGLGQAAAQKQRDIERDLEGRIVSLLEPAVGQGAVIAKVTATVDSSEVSSQEEKFDPEGAVLRSERKVASQQQQQDRSAGGVAGAAANQPLQQPSAGAGLQGGKGSNASTDDSVKNFEISKVTTTTVQRGPRLRRLSIAVMVDGSQGKPRADAEVAHYGELAKRAVGFDGTRGDVLEISSQVFAKAAEAPAAAIVPPTLVETARNVAPFAIGGVIALALLAIALRRRGPAPKTISPKLPALVLKPGARVADIEAQLASAADELPKPVAPPLGLPDPSVVTRDKAREFATQDPQRAAHLLKAWIQNDLETEARNG